jgi:hypothetical protein
MVAEVLQYPTPALTLAFVIIPGVIPGTHNQRTAR